jgi:hypothetical protein
MTEWMLGPDGKPTTTDDQRPRLGCLDRGGVPPGRLTWSLTAYLGLRIDCHRSVAAPETLLFGQVEVTIIAANGCIAPDTCYGIDRHDENGHSLVIRIRYKDFVYMHMADLPGGGGRPPYQTVDIESLVAQGTGDTDVLFVGHHGSKTSTNETLLNAVTVILTKRSCGDLLSTTSRSIRHAINMSKSRHTVMATPFEISIAK